ncbi:hypothetical protein [Phenylobacterium sp.]|jgi:hypothetical protein|uniref:hypothetical protein n=1 Tax=Phenylobacterium sp. TaxID=1871053 RepID=UPI002F418534
MQAFDYLSVLLSIVLGLGLTQLLSAVARWMELRHEVKPYAPAAIWAVFLMVVLVQTWWSMFGMRGRAAWSFLQFCVVLAQPTLLYLLTALALPGPQSEERDLERFFFRHRSWFFGLLMALLVVSVSKDLVLGHRLPSTPNLAFQAVFFIGAVVALVVRRNGVQLLIAIIALVLMLAYIATLFANLA